VERAIEHYDQALAIAREIGDGQSAARRSWNIGLLYEESDPARAVEFMSVLVAYEREIGAPDAEADAERVAQITEKIVLWKEGIGGGEKGEGRTQQPDFRPEL
jgi:hypothetical protein